MRHPPTAAIVAAVLVAGCSGGTSAAPRNSGDQAFLGYASCMRQHGVSDFPDPVQRPGHSGLSLEIPENNRGPTYRAADASCRHLIQAIIDMKTRYARDRLTPARLQGLIDYARCMRAHQVSMLDPDPADGHLALGTVPGLAGSSVGRDSPQFRTADAACRSRLPAGVPDDGSGPP